MPVSLTTTINTPITLAEYEKSAAAGPTRTAGNSDGKTKGASPTQATGAPKRPQGA
jgi:hypothetical protein